jgi:AraC-like DNA-binding protein
MRILFINAYSGDNPPYEKYNLSYYRLQFNFIFLFCEFGRVHDPSFPEPNSSYFAVSSSQIRLTPRPFEMSLIHRIDTAKRLLSETTEPVTTIARQSGFNSTNQFYLTFRNHVGMSPTETRTQLAL